MAVAKARLFHCFRMIRVNHLKLLFLLLILSLVNLFWLSYNSVPPPWDAANHLHSSLKYHQVMSDYLGQPDLLSMRSVKLTLWNLVGVDQTVYPPLYPFLSSFVIFVAGGSVLWLSMMNLVFMAILLYALFEITRKIQNEQVALLACTLFICYPIIFNTSRQFMIETALLAMAALSCYFLLYSDEFSDLLFTSLFGVSIGLGLLTKLTYLVYIIGPVCYVIFLMAIGVMRGSLPIRECIWRFCRLLPSVTVGLLLAGLWYGPNYANFTANLQSVVSLDTIGHNRWDVDSSLYYLNTIIVKNIGLPFFVLFAFGFWRTAQSLKPSHFWFLSIWGLSIYVILSLQTLKHDLMIMGVLFPVCIVSAIGISNLSRWKTAVGSLVLIFGISQFITLSLPEDWLAARIGKAGRFSWAGRYAIFPAKEDWKIREALSRIVEENAHAKIGVVSDHMFINGTTIKLYAELMGVPSEVTFCHSIYRSKKRDIRSFEYIIAKSDIEWVPRDVPGDYCITSRDQYRIVLNQLEAGSLNFELFAKYPLPDATEMLVYKQRTNGASVSSASWKTKTGG